MKLLIVIALLGIVAALASAGVMMLRRRPGTSEAGGTNQATDKPSAAADENPDRRMARALAVRVGISVSLFLFILLAWKMGWVQPSGLPIGR